MQSPTRRAFLAGGTALTLSCGLSIASAKPNSDEETTIRLKVDDDVGSSGRCHLPQDTADRLGISGGKQVRLLYEGEPTVFTLDTRDDKFGAVSAGGRDRLGAAKNSFRVETDSQVVHPTMDATTASETGEFIERHVSGATSTIALAPHGGYIEYGTDLQAQRFADRLGATAWYCSGWWPGGGAYRRWHVTSTYINPDSFPALNAIRDIGFDTAVSFHGWGESFIAVGGTASTEVKEEVRDAIATAVAGAFEVRLATDSERNGTNPDNIVNWITESGQSGIQIEQPWAARKDHRDAIVDGVTDIIG